MSSPPQLLRSCSSISARCQLRASRSALYAVCYSWPGPHQASWTLDWDYPTLPSFDQIISCRVHRAVLLVLRLSFLSAVLGALALPLSPKHYWVTLVTFFFPSHGSCLPCGATLHNSRANANISKTCCVHSFFYSLPMGLKYTFAWSHVYQTCMKLHINLKAMQCTWSTSEDEENCSGSSMDDVYKKKNCPLYTYIKYACFITSSLSTEGHVQAVWLLLALLTWSEWINSG